MEQYSTVVQTGVRAFRVPLEDFAALAEPGGTCPLQLIVEATTLASRYAPRRHRTEPAVPCAPDPIRADGSCSGPAG